MARARKPKHKYTVHMARHKQRCVICTRAIEVGQYYTRRPHKTVGGQWVNIAKCSDCLPIPASQKVES